MKKLLSGVVVTLALVACSAKLQHKSVGPMPVQIDISNIQDATVPAGFTSHHFNWEDGILIMTVYNEDIYDTAELESLAIDDTLLWNDERIIVKEISQNGKIKVINRGLEDGGAELIQNEDGTYRGLLWDESPTYTRLGIVQLPFANNLTIIECGEFPTDPYDTIRTGQRQYLEKLEDTKAFFISLNTKVKIENGKVTTIIRSWIP